MKEEAQRIESSQQPKVSYDPVGGGLVHHWECVQHAIYSRSENEHIHSNGGSITKIVIMLLLLGA